MTTPKAEMKSKQVWVAFNRALDKWEGREVMAESKDQTRALIEIHYQDWLEQAWPHHKEPRRGQAPR